MLSSYYQLQAAACEVGAHAYAILISIHFFIQAEDVCPAAGVLFTRLVILP